MSVRNNRHTLRRCLGKVWLTRPAPPGGGACQDINVCVEEGGDFFAVDCIQLAPDGRYYKKGRALGTLEDGSFRQYIEKLAGENGKNRPELFRQVCERYAACGDMGQVAQALGLSKERVRRILITEGAYTNDLVANIAWLYDDGRGKTVAEIAEMLNVSQSTVQKNMAYGKHP